MLYYYKKKRKKKTEKQNKDLLPVSTRLQNNDKVIRIKKSKKLKIRPVSAAKPVFKHGRNMEMCTTMSSIGQHSKQKRKPKLPSLKLSFDFDTSGNAIPTVSSNNLTRELLNSGHNTPFKSSLIGESKRSHKLSSISSEDSFQHYSQSRLQKKHKRPNHTATGFFNQNKVGSGIPPPFHNAQKPPIARVNKHK
mmetsp:Transcript_29194/g.33417  ORF Transcript_29194/g.33417 Transcript_29194/m.33417 type:complete len:193 (-) Transcript_29194:27-605(-)